MSKIQENRLYNYFHGGQEKSSHVENVSGGMVFLENGEKFSVAEFTKLVNQDVDDDDSGNEEFDEESFLKQSAKEFGESPDVIPRMNIKFTKDELGMAVPVLQTSESGNEEYNDVVAEEGNENAGNNNANLSIDAALKKLLNSAEKQEINLVITIPIKTIDKSLFSVLCSSFKGSDDSIIKYLANTANMSTIKEIIEKEIGNQLGKNQ